MTVTGGAASGAAGDHGGAQLLPPAMPVSGAISGPKDPAWYILDERTSLNPGEVDIVIDHIRAPAGCHTSQPLLVSLYNPERHFMAAVRPQAGDRPGAATYRFVTEYSGRYLVQVDVAHPVCAPLRYAIPLHPLPTPTTGTSFISRADICAGDKAAVSGDRRALGKLRAMARKLSKRTQARYARLIRVQAALVTSDVQIANHDCGRHA